MPGKSSPHLVLLIVVLLSIIPQLTLAQPNQNFSVSLSAIPAPSLDELRYLDNVIAFMNGVEGFHPVSSVPGCAAKQAHTCVPFAGRTGFPCCGELTLPAELSVISSPPTTERHVRARWTGISRSLSARPSAISVDLDGKYDPSRRRSRRTKVSSITAGFPRALTQFWSWRTFVYRVLTSGTNTTATHARSIRHK